MVIRRIRITGRGAGRAARALTVWLAVLMAGPVHAQLTLTDATGRQVTLDAPARRVALNEADLILSLMLLADDPVQPIAAWGSPERLDPGIVSALRTRFPAIDAIPVAGSASPGDFSVEAVVAESPDLYVIRLFDAGWEPMRARLESAGIPVIYLDAPTLDGLAPDRRVAFSLTLLGQAIGRAERARDYDAFIRVRYDRVARIVADAASRPQVLVDGHATPDCCWVPGRGNRLAELVSFVGGDIVGSDLVPGYAGKISAEYILSADPQILITTGGPHLSQAHGLVLGVGQDGSAAEASLAAVLATGIRPEIAAVRNGRSHGILHLLTISPLEVLAVEAFARWIHPEVAADIDPARTLEDINRRFLPVPLDGALWVDQPVK